MVRSVATARLESFEEERKGCLQDLVAWFEQTRRYRTIGERAKGAQRCRCSRFWQSFTD